MISVCIPIHNYHVLPLATSIAAQADGVDMELVCIDDGSTPEFVERNRPIADFGQYIVLGENVGRARVRNLFLQYTKGDYLLFLDDDCIVGEGFMKRYDEVLRECPDVVVGGRVYDPRFNDQAHRLRYTYGQRVECRTAEQRAREPHNSFMTNNFLVSRSLFEQIRFDERLAGYGHEDTLFGYRLRQQGARIMHIENPVTNGDVETNDVFLRKSVEAVESLSQIYGFMRGDKEFCNSVRLLRTYGRVRRFGLGPFVLALFRIRRNGIKSKLENGRSNSLFLFNLYKLGAFIAIQRNK